MAPAKVYINNRIKDFGEDKRIFLEKILQIGALCSSVVVRRGKDGKNKKRKKLLQVKKSGNDW